MKLNTGDKIEIIVAKEGEAVIRPVSKKVDEMFGKLRQPGRKAAAAEEMNNAIRERMRDTFRS